MFTKFPDRLMRLRASVLAVLLLGTVLSVVVGAPTTASAQTTDTTTTTDTPETPEPVDREFAGADRYETSANLAYSYAAKSSSSNSVILAGGGLIDAAAAAGLARAINAPVLLTPTGTLSPQARQFIIDQRIRTVYVVGGPAAVSAAVTAELDALSPPPTVERLSGPDRYATSAALSRAVTQTAQPAGTQPAAAADYCGTGVPTAVLANVDKTFADVIALGPLAYSQRLPVLLTSVDSLSQAVSEYLAEANIEQVVVVGGEAAVSPAVVAQLQAAGVQVQRVSGANRYATALSIRAEMGACEGLTLSPSTYALINGEASADGIAAGPLLGLGLARDGVTPVLLVEKDRLPPESREHLDAVNAAQQSNPSHPPVVLTVIGGVAVVAPAVAQAAAETAAATQAVAPTTTQPDDDDDDDDNGGGGGGGGGSGGGGGGGGSGGGPTPTNPPAPPTTVPPAATLTGVPATATVAIGTDPAAATETIDFTVSPADATVTATNTGPATATVAAASSGTAGAYTLTITAPATDDGTGPYSDTVTISASAPNFSNAAQTIAVTITPAPITLSGLLAAAPAAFEFGGGDQTLPFTVAPASATLSFDAVSTNSLVTAAVTGTGADRTLTISPAATDPDTGTYTDTVTITATDTADGRSDVVRTVAVVLNQTSSDVSITAVDGGANAFAFAETARTVTFNVTPADATVTVVSANSAATANNALTIGTPTGTGTATRSFTVTAPASDDGAGPYYDTVTITATSGAETATHSLIYALTPTPLTLTGLLATAIAPFTFGGQAQTQTYDFAVTPPNAAVTFTAIAAEAATNGVTASVAARGTTAGDYRLTVSAPATDDGAGPYTDTVTVTATDTADNGRAAATHDVEITLTPTPISLTGVPDAQSLEYASAATDYIITVSPPTITLAAAATGSVVTPSITVLDAAAGTWTLTVTPPTTGTTYTDTVTITATDPDSVAARTEVTATIDFTVTLRSAATFTGLAPADVVSAFIFGGTASTTDFSVSPATVTVTISPTSSTLFSTWSLTGSAGSYALTVQPIPTDLGTGGPYSETVTITASEDGRTAATEEIVFTISPPPVALTGTIITNLSATLDYGDATPSTYTITASPASAVLTVTSDFGVVTPSIARTAVGAATWTLSLTAPSTGAALSDRIRITATDPTRESTLIPIAVTVTPRAAATFTDLDAAGITDAFEFGDGVRTIPFTVSPTTVSVAIAPTTSTLFSTWALAGSAGSYTLTIAPIATDPGTATSYSEALTVTASEDGRAPATQDLTFAINPSAIEISGLPDDATTPFTFGGTDQTQTFDFTVTPAAATVAFTAIAAEAATNGVTAAVAARGSNAGDYTLTVTAPTADTGAGPYTDTVTVTATSTGRAAATHDVEITLTPTPISLTGVPDAQSLEYASAATDYIITVSPPTITLAAAATGSVVGATVTVLDAAAGTWTLSVTPPTTGTTYTDTVTITATDPETDSAITRTEVTATIDFTITLRSAATFTGLALADVVSAFIFGGTADTTDFSVSPATVTVTISPTSSNLFSTWSLTNNGSGNYALTIAPAPTDPGTGGPYSETVTITASEDGRVTATEEIVFTISPPPVALTGTIITNLSATLDYGDATPSTYTITADPATAVLAVTSDFGVVTPSIAVLDAAAGTWTLSLTAPSTGAALSDRIRITATDQTRESALIPIAVTVTPIAAATFTGLEAAGITDAFEFGDTARTIDFTVNPTTVSVAIAPATSTLFSTWALAGSAGSYTLTIQPLGTDPGTGSSYSEALTVTASEDGRAPATQDLTFAINPSAIEISGLPDDATTPFTFSGTTRTQTFDFTVTPAAATVTFTAVAAGAATNGVTAAVAARGSNAGDYTLTVTAPTADTGAGPYADTVTVTATSTGRAAATHDVEITLTPAPITLSGVPTDPTLEYAAAAATDYIITVSPPTITLAATATDGVVGATVTVLDAAAGTWTLTVTPPTTGTTYTDTVTITATDPETDSAITRTEVTATIDFTISPPPVALTGTIITDLSATLDYADATPSTYMITAVPATATLTVTSDFGVVTPSITVLNAAAGTWTLSLTAPSTGAALSDRIRITATDPTRQSTLIPISVTVTPRAAATFTGLDAAGITDAFAFGDGVRTIPFTVNPTTVSVAIAPATSTLFSTWSITDNGSGSYTLSIAPIATDPVTATSYSETLTITATEDGRTQATQDLAFTINPAASNQSVILTGTVITDATATLEYAGTSTHTITADPTTATLTVASANSVVDAAIAASGTAGEWTLTLTAPTSGTALTDTVTVTATDSTRTTTTVPIAVTVTPRAAATFTGLDAAGITDAFEFDDTARTIDFTVSPATVPVTIAPATSTLFSTWSLTSGATAGSYTLSIAPLGTDPGTGSPYSETLTVTASEDGRTAATQELAFTINPAAPVLPAITIGQLPTSIDDLAFGSGEVEHRIVIAPETANVVVASVDGVVTTSVDASGRIRGFFYQAPATDTGTGPYTDTIRVTADATGHNDFSVDIPVTLTPAPAAVTGIPTDTDLALEYGADASTFTLTAFPTDATVTATSTSSAITTGIAVADAATGTHTLTITPAATGTSTATATVTIGATDTDNGRTAFSQTVDFTVNPPAPPATIALTVDINNRTFNYAANPELEFGTTPRYQAFTVTPADATVTVASTNNLFTVAVEDTYAGKLLVVTPPATDGGTYSDTVTITATHADYETATLEQIFSINPTSDADTTITVAATIIQPADLTVDFGGSDSTGRIRIFFNPGTATGAYSTIVSRNGLFRTIVSNNQGPPPNSNKTNRSFVARSIAADPGDGVYTDTLILTTGGPGFRTVVNEFTATINAPLAITSVAADTSAFAFNETERTVTFNIAPADATFEAVSTNATNAANNAFTVAKVLDSGTARSFTVTPPASDDGFGPYIDTITITATSGTDTIPHELDYTLTPAPIALSGVPTGTDLTLTYGDPASEFTLTAFPTDATVTATSTGSTITTDIAVADADAGTHTLSITPAGTGTSTANATVTIGATDPDGGRTAFSQDIVFSVSVTPPVVLTGTVITDTAATVEYAGTSTHTITAEPTTATLNVASSDSVVGAAIDASGTAGEWTLTLTAPTTGAVYADTVTVTATDSTRTTTTVPIAVTVSLRGRAFLSVGLADTSAFDFGDDVREIDFTVDPDTMTVAISPTTSPLFNTWNLVNNGSGGYTLNIQPLADDPGDLTSYSETITITATEDGREPATETLTFTVNPSPIDVTGLPTGAALTLTYGADASEFTLTAFPTDATVTATSTSSAITTDIDVANADTGTHTLTITPAASGTTATATVTIGATDPDGGRTAFSQTVDFTVNPPPPVTITGLPTTNTSPFVFVGPSRVQPLTFTVSPANATVTATVGGGATNGLTAAVSGAGTSRTLTTTAPTTDSGTGPYTDTVTVTGSAPGFADATHEMAITIVPAPVTVTLTSPDTSAFNHADGSRDIGFTVAPANATVEVSQTNDSFTATIVGSGGSRTLRVTPPASDDGTGADAAAYSNTITLTASTTDVATAPRTPATATDAVTVTVNPAPIALSGLPTGTALTLSYGNAASVFTLTAFPTDATVTANSTSSAITTGIVVANAATGTHTLTITPAGTGTTTTNATVTIGATDANSLRTAFSEDIVFSVSAAPPVVLTGTVITDTTATVEYAGTAEYTITANPATATLTVASSDSVVVPSIAPGTGAGVWTLTLTAPTSGTTLTDTVTVTATDSTRTTTTVPIAVTVSLRPAAAISADLSTTDVSPFEFSGAARFTVFSVNPGTVPLTYSPTTSAFFRTWEINPIGSSGDYGLNVYPLATDPDTATSYSETLTVTATEDGREPATEVLTFTINPSPVSVTGLPTGADLTLEYGAAASTFTLTAFPTDATVTATATPGSAVTASVDAVVGTPGNHTLTITPAASGSNTVTATVTIGATDPDGVRTEFSQPVDFTVNPAATEVVLTGLPTSATTPFTFSGTNREQTFDFTVTPGTATFVASTASSTVTAEVTGAGTSRTLTVTAPTADTGTGPYSDTITLTASATGLTAATHNLPITLTPAPVSITFVGSPQTSAFDHGDGVRQIRFTATPNNAVLTVDQTNDSFTSSIFPGFVNLHVLRVAPPSTDDATDASAYTNTITLTATTTDSATGRTPLTASQTLTFRVNPGLVAVEGLPTGTELTLDYAAASPSTFTLVANPTDAEVTATSANGIVTASVDPISSTPGSHTLTITPPSTGTTYTDTVTITATDPDAGRPQFSQTLTFTITPPPPVTFPQALPTAIGPLAFGISIQDAIFSVNPATAAVTAESVDGILQDISVIENTGARRTLRYRPPDTDGGTYADTIRVTATAPGFATTMVEIPVTFVEPVVSFTGLDTADTNFAYGSAARDIVFTVTPADATVTISATTIFTTSITAGTGGSRTLTVTPPADNTGGTEETVTITGAATDLTNGTYDLTLTGVDPATITLDPTHQGNTELNWEAISARLIELEFGTTPRYQAFKVTPTDATVTVASTNSLFTVSTRDTHIGKLLVVTPPATDDGNGPYADTVTITATHADYATATLEQTFSINPAADTDIAVTISNVSAFGPAVVGSSRAINYGVSHTTTYSHAVSMTGLFVEVVERRDHGPGSTRVRRALQALSPATNDVLGGRTSANDTIILTVGAPGFRTVTRTFTLGLTASR